MRYGCSIYVHMANEINNPKIAFYNKSILNTQINAFAHQLTNIFKNTICIKKN